MPLPDLETVTDYLRMLMGRGKDFRQYDPRSYPIPTEKVAWFVQSSNPIADDQTRYVYTIWAEVDDTLHIETETLGQHHRYD